MEEISKIKKFAKINSVPIMKDEGIDFICDYIVKVSSYEDAAEQICRGLYIEEKGE